MNNRANTNHIKSGSKQESKLHHKHTTKETVTDLNTEPPTTSGTQKQNHKVSHIKAPCSTQKQKQERIQK